MPAPRSRGRHRRSDCRLDRSTAPRGVPLDDAARYLVRDRDAAFHAWATTAKATDIHEVVTAARSPWQNAIAESLIGSIRRECLDHVIGGLHHRYERRAA